MLATLFLSIASFSEYTKADELLGEQQGQHIGELESIDYEIGYTNAIGFLTIDEDGCHYYSWNWSWSTPCNYDVKYYGTYAVYFSGSTITYQVTLRNVGKRTFRNLMVTARQEYHEDLEEWNYAGWFSVEQGDPLPGDSTDKWHVEELRPGEEIVLEGSYFAPTNTHPGLDQTHLQVQHWFSQNGLGSMSDGRIILDDSTAGVYAL